MLIMNISTPQQDIGVRVSLPLESHHIDIFLENVLPVRADDKGERNKVERKRVDIARNAREVCALEIKINRSEKPQQNPSWDSMLIMNISTPQQDIGFRVSLPLESHHIDHLKEFPKVAMWEGRRTGRGREDDSTFLPSKSWEFTKNSTKPGRLSP